MESLKVPSQFHLVYLSIKSLWITVNQSKIKYENFDLKNLPNVEGFEIQNEHNTSFIWLANHGVNNFFQINSCFSTEFSIKIN